jgi:hypothetical protein
VVDSLVFFKGTTAVFLREMGGFALTVLSDCLVIALNRKILQSATLRDRTGRLIIYFLLNIGLVLILILPVLLWGFPFHLRVVETFRYRGMLLVAGVGNLITSGICLLWGAAMLTFLVHKWFWPVLQRPIYAAARHGLLKKRKLLVTLAVLLITHALKIEKVLPTIEKLIK